MRPCLIDILCFVPCLSWGQCAFVTSIGDINTSLDVAEKAFGDLDGFGAALDEVAITLPCVNEIIRKTDAARLHRSARWTRHDCAAHLRRGCRLQDHLLGLAQRDAAVPSHGG